MKEDVPWFCTHKKGEITQCGVLFHYKRQAAPIRKKIDRLLPFTNIRTNLELMCEKKSNA